MEASAIPLDQGSSTPLADHAKVYGPEARTACVPCDQGSSTPPADHAKGYGPAARAMDFVTVQHFHDGMHAGLEAVARTTATHPEKLEQRVAAAEEKAIS